MIYKLCDWSRSWRRSKFTLRPSRSSIKTKSKILMDETSRWCPTWQQVDDVLWAIGYFIRPIKKSWVSRKTRGCGNQWNCHGILLVLYCHGKPKHVLQSENMIHFHFTLSLKAHPCVNLDFYIPLYVAFGRFSRALRILWSQLWVVHKVAPALEVSPLNRLVAAYSIPRDEILCHFYILMW